jgi:hypothetical protein
LCRAALLADSLATRSLSAYANRHNSRAGTSLRSVISRQRKDAGRPRRLPALRHRARES